MKYDLNYPIWLQVMQSLQTDIVTGKLPPGSKLPGGRDLALSYEINPNTAARVYQELEKNGLCETRRGLGTFVTDNPERISSLRSQMADTAVDRFLSRMNMLGISREEAVQIILKKEG